MIDPSRYYLLIVIIEVNWVSYVTSLSVLRFNWASESLREALENIVSLPPFRKNLIPSFTGVSKLLASLGHTGRRRVVLGHTLNTPTLRKTEKQKNSFK